MHLSFFLSRRPCKKIELSLFIEQVENDFEVDLASTLVISTFAKLILCKWTLANICKRERISALIYFIFSMQRQLRIRHFSLQ